MKMNSDMSPVLNHSAYGAYTVLTRSMSLPGHVETTTTVSDSLCHISLDGEQALQ